VIVSSRRRPRTLALVVVASILFAHAQPAFAYFKFGVNVNGTAVALHWATTPVRYFVNDQGANGVTPSQFQTAVARAFSTWEAVPTASISYQFVGFTGAEPGEDDGLSTLGFLNRPDLDRVLATTSFVIDNSTGALVESDIFFNSAFDWSTAEAGESGRFDIQSTALHEIGHLSGLGHSALGETELREGGGRRVLAADAIMFPIAYGTGTTAGRTLRADDIAGISDIYPGTSFRSDFGSISGKITKNGSPLFGAHVVAFDPRDGTLVATFTLGSQGQFSIAGLSPGPHILRVEPIDDADLDSFFAAGRNVDIDFRVTYADSIVTVPKGGDSGSISVQVGPK
jgi:Matrixin